MKNLNYELNKLAKIYPSPSIATQKNRRSMLNQIADELHDGGFKKMSVQGLKPKHIDHLLSEWNRRGLTEGTIKNRMSTLRWWAKHIRKDNVIAKTNSHYAIPNRKYVTNISKGQDLDEAKVDKISCPYTQVSLKLQRAFGLRRQEAIKFAPKDADKREYIVLNRSWTKGGKERIIEVTTLQQRAILEEAHKLAGHGALIKPGRNYIQQLRVYERHTTMVGLSKQHGLRHKWAQDKYEELTGRPCPNAGGKRSRQMNRKEKEEDRKARLEISAELGHFREQVTAIYLGR